MSADVFIDQYFWLIAFVFSLVNIWRYQKTIKPLMKGKRKAGYQNAVFALWAIPLVWLLMGVGVSTGIVSGTLSFFNLSQANAFVWIWHGVVAALVLAFTWWVFFAGGEQFFKEHPGLLGQTASQALRVRELAMFVLGLLIVFEFLMWFIASRVNAGG